MDKRFLGILAGIIVIFTVIFAVSQHSGNGSGNSNNSNSNQPTSHIEGQGKSGVTLVEYGDYECPICGEYFQPLQQVYDQFQSQIYFQFRNLPLSQIHPNAFAGARAAEAAGMQGKYFQMHDQLYENQDPSGASGWVASKNPLDDYFVGFAKSIGLDTTKFKQDYASEQANNAVNADLNAFSKTGQEMATPTFFLDGKPLDNTSLGVVNSTGTALDTTKTVANFAKVLNAEIAAKSSKN